MKQLDANTTTYQQKPHKPMITPSAIVGNCPLCRRQQMTQFALHQHLGTYLNYQICRYCGLVFMSPRFRETDLQQFYRHEYRLAYSGSEEPTAEEIEEQRERAVHLTGWLDSKIRPIRSHLDIGSSTGGFLQSMRSVFQVEHSVGVEPSIAHRTLAVSYGIEIYPSIDEVFTANKHYDLISIVHVLEHLPNPIEYLQDIRTKLLSPDGYLLIEVPNLYGHMSFEVAHLVCFSQKTLLEVLHCAGFEELRVKIHGIPRRHGYSQRYITVLAAPNSQYSDKASIRRIWWRCVQILRFKGLTNKSWVRLAIFAPLIFIRRIMERNVK